MHVGDAIGRYRIDGLLARGGMAEVYQATAGGSAGFGKPVAIKIPLQHIAEDDELAQLFVDETRLAAQLTHRNIVAILELGKHRGRHFIAMELVDGASLARVIDSDGALPHALALQVAAEVAAALQFAHTAADEKGDPLRVVHRDVCPSNILLSVQGDVKLVDFGIAKAASRSRHTQANVIRGKVRYLAPEQANLGDVGPAADQFSLGLVLFEMLTGHALYDGDSDLAILDRARGADVASALDHAKLPPNLRDVLERMLATRAFDRFGDLDEARAALLETVEQLDPGVPADEHRKDLARRVAKLDRTPIRQVEKTKRRPHAALIGIALVAVAAAIAITVFVAARDETGTTAEQPQQPQRAMDTPAQSDRLYIRTWSNETDSPELEEIATLAPAIISERLAAMRSIQLIAHYRFAEAKKEPSPIAGWSLEGTAHKSAGQIELRVRLVDPRGNTIDQWTVQTEARDLPSALDGVAERAAAAFDETLSPRRTQRLPLEAARIRYHAFRSARALSPQGYRTAIRKFRELARHTPGQPEPYLWSGILAWWTGPEGLPWINEIAADARASGVDEYVLEALAVMRGFVADGHAAHKTRSHALLRDREDDPLLLLIAGEADVHTGDVGLGVERLERALELEPTLFFARHHPLDVALLHGDEERIDYLIALRSVDPLDPQVEILRIRRLIALRKYREANSQLANTTSARLVNMRALLRGVLGQGLPTNSELERAARRDGSASYRTHLHGMSLALLLDDTASYDRWVALALPAGKDVLGGASSPNPTSDFRFAADAQILEVLAKGNGTWDSTAERIATAIGKLTAQDRRLRHAMRAITAHARKDTKALVSVATHADPDLATYASALVLAARGEHAKAVEAYRRALAASPDGRFGALIRAGLARSGRAAGDSDTSREACERLRAPRHLEVYVLAAIPACRDQ